MSNPHTMSTEVWLDIANAAIAGIRRYAPEHLILVSGFCYYFVFWEKQVHGIRDKWAKEVNVWVKKIV